MTREERKLALYCLKASSDYHSEVCEECINYPNCDHMIQDDVTETIIKALEEQETKYCDRNICVSNEYNGIGCNECEVTKSQELKTDYIVHGTDGNIYKLTISNGKEFEQETCDDAVSRADVRHLIAEVKRKSLYSISSKAFEKLYNGIDDLPPVNPQPKKGHWISLGVQEVYGQNVQVLTCSECGVSIFRISSGNIVNGDICPNCGARMEREG